MEDDEYWKTEDNKVRLKHHNMFASGSNGNVIFMLFQRFLEFVASYYTDTWKLFSPSGWGGIDEDYFSIVSTHTWSCGIHTWASILLHVALHCGIPSCPKSTLVMPDAYLIKWTDQVLFLETRSVAGRKLMVHKRRDETRGLINKGKARQYHHAERTREQRQEEMDEVEGSTCKQLREEKS